jgi:AraC-like DNA-binding protein
MYTKIMFEKVIKKNHQLLLEGKEYLMVVNNGIKDSSTIPSGVYYDGNMVDFNYTIKKLHSNDGYDYIETINDVITTMNKSINVSDLKYNYEEIISYNNISSEIKEGDVIKFPIKQSYLLVKKLDLNNVNDIKDFIYTFIFINGFKLDILIDLILNQVNSVNNYKNKNIKNTSNFIFGTWDAKNIKKIYFDICDNIKNKHDIEELNYYKQKNILHSNFIINYDMINFDDCEDVKTYLNKLKIYKANLKRSANSKLEILKIINYIKENNSHSIENIAETLKVSEKYIRNIINKFKLELKEGDKKLNKLKIKHKVCLLHNIKPSIQYLSESTDLSINYIKDKCKENNLEVISHSEFKNNLKEKQNIKNIIIEEVEKVKKLLNEDDCDFWLMDKETYDKKIYNELCEGVDNILKEEYKKDKEKKNIDIIDYMNNFDEKLKSSSTIEKIYKKISINSSMKTLELLSSINDFSTLSNNNFINNRDEWGKVIEDDLGDEM